MSHCLLSGDAHLACQIFDAPDIVEEETNHRRGDEWQKHCAKFREELGVPSDYRPWSSKEGVTLRGVPRRPRYLECIELAWIDRVKRFRASGLDVAQAHIGFYVDFSQAAQRRPWGSAKTLMQGPLCTRAHSRVS
jgi:hypothetical protein